MLVRLLAETTIGSIRRSLLLLTDMFMCSYKEVVYMSTDEIIDIEQYAKESKSVPIGNGNGYKIRVDKEKYVVQDHLITGRGILILAGKTPPESYRLDQKMRGGSKQKIELNQTVDLSTPGVERFLTLPLDTTEG